MIYTTYIVLHDNYNYTSGVNIVRTKLSNYGRLITIKFAIALLVYLIFQLDRGAI